MSDFETFARDHGLIIRHIEADGRVHRVPTVGHPRKRNGAYSFDGRKGFVQAWDVHAEAIPFRGGDAPRTVAVQKSRHDDAAARRAAKVHARAIVARSSFLPHAYLALKGFPSECGLVDPTDGRLIVPMYDAAMYGRELVSVQRIAADGSKLFLKGGAAKDAVYHLGRGSTYVLVEGFATALSVRAAMVALYRPACVVVCFSAGNLVSVARRYPRALVVADNDESGTGERAARSSGLSWVMPPDVGTDANDMHLRRGLPALCDLIRTGA